MNINGIFELKTIAKVDNFFKLGTLIVEGGLFRPKTSTTKDLFEPKIVTI